MNKKNVINILLAALIYLYPTISTATTQHAIKGLPKVECNTSASEKPWLDINRSPECRALDALSVLTEVEKRYFSIGLL